MASSSSALFDELSKELGAELVGNPYPTFEERRRDSPVMKGDIMAEFGLPSMVQSLGTDSLYTFFRYDDISEALKDSQTYSSSVVQNVFIPILGRVVLGMDGTEHRAWRGMLTPAFTKRLVDFWHTSMVRPVARDLVTQMAAEGNRANLVDLALRFPVRMIYEIVGFPESDEAYEEFASAGLTMGLAVQGINGSSPEETMRALQFAREAADGVSLLIRPIVERRRAAGGEGDDLIAHLLRAEFEGERLDDDQVTGFVRSLLPAAADTTSRSWLNVMTCLLERPALVDAVRDDRSLVIGAINEGLRLESATTVLGRVTTRDVEIRGVSIPAGSGITLATGSANRDEDVYVDAETYDLRRSTPKPALNFGLGPHFCPGMQIAKVEMLETMNAMFDLLPGLRLDPEAPAPVIRGLMMRCPEQLPVVWD